MRARGEAANIKIPMRLAAGAALLFVPSDSARVRWPVLRAAVRMKKSDGYLPSLVRKRLVRSLAKAERVQVHAGIIITRLIALRPWRVLLLAIAVGVATMRLAVLIGERF